MKIHEIRLYKLKILKDDEIVFEGMSEKLPEELKEVEVKNITLAHGEAVIKI